MTILRPFYLFLIVAALLALLPVLAQAETCRDIPSVRQSAELSQNTQMGGHVKAHVLGQTPPAGQSQAGRTLFESAGRYETVWGRYRRGTPAQGVNCSGSGQKGQNVPASALSSNPIAALSCQAANASGKCTEWKEYIAREIQFYFVRSGGQWILTTAYPIPQN